MAIRFIYFDCMDTLIHMDVPSLEVYGEWAFDCARCLGLWDEPEEFLAAWRLHRDRRAAEEGHREGTIRGRLQDLIGEAALRRGLAWDAERVRREVDEVQRGYWDRYRRASFILPEVPESLERIQRGLEMPLGVVSNFMVEGGIPSLLAQHGLDRFFQVVLVSCDHGWRKPAPSIYQAAIEATGMAPEEILFVGDNPDADYHGPRGAGMYAILYDRRRVHAHLEPRVETFREIERWL